MDAATLFPFQEEPSLYASLLAEDSTFFMPSASEGAGEPWVLGGRTPDPARQQEGPEQLFLMG